MLKKHIAYISHKISSTWSWVALDAVRTEGNVRRITIIVAKRFTQAAAPNLGLNNPT